MKKKRKKMQSKLDSFKLNLDKEVLRDTLLVLSGLCTNLSAGWLGSIFILPIFFDTKPFVLLTANLSSAIFVLIGAIWFAGKARSL